VTSRRGWLAALVLGQLALGEWIRAPGLLPAVVLVLCLAAAALALARRGWTAGGLALVLAAQAGLALAAQIGLTRIQRSWPDIRERRITEAAARWERDLRGARATVERLAEASTRAAGLDHERAFARLTREVARQPLEVGLAILEADGTPFAWAGRHRLPPEVRGDSIDFHATSYYAVIESRRQVPGVGGGTRVVIASALLAADSAVPDRGRSLASRFEAETGVALVILPPGVAPDSSDVFDYVEPRADGPRLLFSVQLAPPFQSAAYEGRHQRASRRLVALGVVVWALALIVAEAGFPRFVLLGLPVAFAIRAPLGETLGLPPMLSPRLFFHSLLGPITQAAGPLALVAGAGLVVGCVALVRRRHRRWWGAPVALPLIVAAPFLLREAGGGIQVPVDGASAALWVTWELALFFAVAALGTLAAALLPVPRKPNRVWPAVAGAGIGVLAAVAGLVVWDPAHGWPAWYPLLSTLALGLAVAPGRRGVTLVGIGIAAGSAAALTTWGEEVQGRVAAARGDLASLGALADPLAVPLLQGFVERADQGAVPRTPPELFALWRATALSRQGFPAALQVWGPAGDLRAALRLDEVDLPDSLVGRRVRELAAAAGAPVVEPHHRVPSVHYLALIRLDSATTLSAGLGPRTVLVPQARLGRLLEPVGAAPSGYRLSLAPTFSVEQPDESSGPFRREGQTARGARVVGMGGAAREVNAVVELGDPAGLLVRGTLLVVLDLLGLAALALLAAWVAGAEIVWPAWLPERRAFRTRIAMALAAFFIVPATGFALLNILEMARDGRSRRDLMIAQTLRDAAPGRTLPLTQGVPDLDHAMEELAERVDANLALYRDGRLIASSGAGVFEEFGLVDQLIDPDVFHRIQLEGEPSAVTDGPSSAFPTRLGVRAVRLPTGEAAMLASPQAAGDPAITRQQLDLAYVVALAVVAGLVAALIGAQLSARALSRPAAELRDTALAFGRGEPLPAHRGSTAAEFEPVFAALHKMVDDLRRTQEAQEHAARVLAWGEMANQIAHEIKNPLTPMRLGIQHLQRVQRDGRAPLGPTLDETARRILGEIDRLDTIARAFSRFAAPAEGRSPPEPVALGAVAREVVDLYALAPSGSRFELAMESEAQVLAHPDEVKEALINLLENARNAGARRVVVRVGPARLVVEDDGAGIPAERLPRIFEPRFSTTTSGSGLGLAIVKRLVEGWGGTIEVASREGRGTTVTIAFAEPAPSGGAGSA
jgi:signal transduction histidine kinase